MGLLKMETVVLFDIIDRNYGKLTIEWCETNVLHLYFGSGVRVVMFSATFNNISVILWRLVLLVEKTGENHRPAESHWQTLSHNVVLRTLLNYTMYIHGLLN
jgi:hypothetical protein